MDVSQLVKLAEIFETTKTKKTQGLSEPEQVFPVGEKVFVRLVTYHLLGRVKKVVGRTIYLEDGSWVADGPRFMNFIKEGKLDEIEPFGECSFNFDARVDVYEWKHALPTEQR